MKMRSVLPFLSLIANAACGDKKLPAWDERPSASLLSSWCVLTPTHRPHFPQTTKALAALAAAAEDTVRLFVAVTDFEEADAWSAHVTKYNEQQRRHGADDAAPTLLPPHTVLSLAAASRPPEASRPLPPTHALTNYSVAALREMVAATPLATGCHMGGGRERQWGHLKKLTALQLLTRPPSPVCEVIWQFDAESRPLRRRFSFREVFTLLGKILVAGGSGTGARYGLRGSGFTPPACMEAAARVHGVRPAASSSSSISRRRSNFDNNNPMLLGLRENDFWLYDAAHFREFVAAATKGTNRRRSFVEAVSAGGCISAELIWLSWLVQSKHVAVLGNGTGGEGRAADGAGGAGAGAGRKSYRLVTVDLDVIEASCALGHAKSHEEDDATDDRALIFWEALRRWSGPASDRSRSSSSSSGGISLDCACLGRQLREGLGQAGLWGDYLFKDWSETNLRKQQLKRHQHNQEESGAAARPQRRRWQLLGTSGAAAAGRGSEEEEEDSWRVVSWTWATTRSSSAGDAKEGSSAAAADVKGSKRRSNGQKSFRVVLPRPANGSTSSSSSPSMWLNVLGRMQLPLFVAPRLGASLAFPKLGAALAWGPSNGDLVRGVPVRFTETSASSSSSRERTGKEKQAFEWVSVYVEVTEQEKKRRRRATRRLYLPVFDRLLAVPSKENRTTTGRVLVSSPYLNSPFDRGGGGSSGGCLGLMAEAVPWCVSNCDRLAALPHFAL
jgi:hypothetical protein